MLRDDKFIHVHGRKLQIEKHELRDEQVADRVATMPYGAISNTIWVSAARDRILYLSQLVAEARDMLLEKAVGWPASQPMTSAPKDGTYVLLQGPEGKAVCRWAGGGATNNPVVMALRGLEGAGYWQCYGSAMAFHNPGRWWPLPQD